MDLTVRICKGNHYRRYNEEVIEIFVLCANMNKSQVIAAFNAVQKRKDELLEAMRELRGGPSITYWYQPGRTRKPEHRQEETFKVSAVLGYDPVIRVYGYNGNHTRILAEVKIQTDGKPQTTGVSGNYSHFRAVHNWLKQEYKVEV